MLILFSSALSSSSSLTWAQCAQRAIPRAFTVGVPALVDWLGQVMPAVYAGEQPNVELVINYLMGLPSHAPEKLDAHLDSLSGVSTPSVPVRGLLLRVQKALNSGGAGKTGLRPVGRLLSGRWWLDGCLL